MGVSKYTKTGDNDSWVLEKFAPVPPSVVVIRKVYLFVF